MASSDFLTGLNKSIQGPNGLVGQIQGILDDRNKYKFELMMKSRAVELELQSKMKQFDFEQTLTPGFQTDLSQKTGMRVGNYQEAQLAQRYGNAELSANARMASAELAKFRAGRPVVKTTQVGNSVVYDWVDPNNPGKILASVTKGVNSSAYKDFSNAEKSYKTIQNVLDSYTEALNEVVNSNEYLDRIKTGVGVKMSDLLSLNNVAARRLNDTANTLALVLGAEFNQGRPTEQDAKAAAALLPGGFASLDIAKDRVNQINDIISAGYKSKAKTLLFGDTPSRQEIYGEDKQTKTNEPGLAEMFKQLGRGNKTVKRPEVK